MADQIICDFDTAVSGDTYSSDETFIIPDNYDLTGAIITMSIVRQNDTNTVLLQLTTTNNRIIIIDKATYCTNFGIVNLEAGNYLYTIKIIFLTGFIKTWVKGQFFVTK